VNIQVGSSTSRSVQLILAQPLSADVRQILKGIDLGEISDRVLGIIRQAAENAIRKFPPSLIHPELPNLIGLWDLAGAANHLTSVGIALAHANLRRKGITEFSLAESLD
jgi:hypothetical protein